MYRIIGIICLVFICISVYMDMTKGVLPKGQNTIEIVPIQNPSHQLHVKRIKVTEGDTVLSISEKLNNQTELDIEQVLSDFRSLNSNINPFEIKANHQYYFPLYTD